MSEGIHTIAMLPIRSRYTEEWLSMLCDSPRYHVPVGSPPFDLTRSAYNYFTNLDQAVQYETDQIIHALLAMPPETRKLFVVDLDFPGLSAAALPLLRLKFPKVEMYAMLHAGSWIKGDLFAHDPVKPILELAAIRGCRKVFVATQYHRDRIQEFFGIEFDNLVITDGFPFDAARARAYVSDFSHSRGVLVTGRKEQIDLCLPMSLECDYSLAPLPRPEYLRLLARYKVVIIPKVDETFGLTALECAALGTVPFVPRDFSYLELLPYELTYRTSEELAANVQRALEDSDQYRRYLDHIDLTRYGQIFDEIADEIERE